MNEDPVPATLPTPLKPPMTLADGHDLPTRRATLTAEQREQLAARWRGAKPQTLIPRADRSAPLPLSFGQEHVWLHQQLEPASILFNRPVRIRLTGPLNREALRQSLQTIVQRHEPLRTQIHNAGDHAVQKILPSPEIGAQVIDLSSDPSAAETLVERLSIESRRPFDLQRDSPFRVQLYRLANEEHCLLILLHHAALDAWSESILIRELSACYAAFSSGRLPTLSDLPLDYVDYATWQRTLPQTKEFVRSTQYWQDNLRDLSALELPTDRPRSADRGEEAEAISFRLDPELTARLRAAARQHDATLFMILLAAWVTLLHRCSGQADLVIGCPVAGRTRPEFEPLIGMFVNTLPLRITTTESMTFQDLVQICRRVILQALEHQSVPLKEIIRTAVLPQGHTGTAGFDAAFIHERFTEARYTAEGITFELMRHFDEAAAADVLLELIELDREVDGSLCFRAGLWDQISRQRMADRWLVLLDSICRSPELPLSRLPLLPPDELRQVMFDWNETQHDDAKDRGLIESFEDWAAKAPAAVAVRFEGRTVSYGELNREANRLAHRLRSAGAQPGELIAVCIDCSPTMIAALLGILKLGAAYLPLDPGHPDDRLRTLLSESGAKWLLTESRHVSRLPSDDLIVCCVDRNVGQQAALSDENPAVVMNPDDLAYVIFTSGSTGKPKGVEIPHRGVMNFLHAMQDCPGLAPGQTALSMATITFDISVLEIFLPLISGGTIELISRELSQDGQRLKDSLDVSPATLLQGTPATWRMLLEAGWTGNPRLTILTGGEHLPRDLAEALLQRSGQVWNVYGPTETTVWATVQKIEPGFERITVGRPIRNMQTYILDRNLQPVAIGAAGELCLAGAGVARGYRHRPELTAEQFIEADLPGRPATRMYRTGDAARYLNDGTIELLGRIDHQIKWRGYRIEPGEIESVLCRHAAVFAAAVALTGDSPERQRLTAYVVADQTRVSLDELRELTRQQLPDYMTPSSYVFLERMPKTSSGKIDRRALPQPQQDQTPRTVQAPQTPTESLTADLWREVLGLSEVSRDDNFFDLGGHSLLVLRVARRLGQLGHRAVPVALLFQRPVLADFAHAIDELQDHRGSPITMLRRGSDSPPLLLFPGLGGEHHHLLHVTQALEAPCSVNVMNWHELPGYAAARSLRELGPICAQAIRAVQPQGPYFLAGFSFGGPLVFEVARSLMEAGGSIGLVAILDSGIKRTAPYTVAERLQGAIRFFQNLPRWLVEDFFQHSPQQMLGRLQRKTREWLRKQGSAPTRVPAARPRQLDEIFDVDLFPGWLQARMQADLNLLANYTPQPAPVRIVLFRARIRPLLRNLLDDLGWNQYALGGVEVVEIPGHHLTMMLPPHVTELARQLSAAYVDAAGLTWGEGAVRH